MNVDLTAEQKDYAVFLPAVSGFYATFVGKQRREEYVDNNRIPKNFVNGVESLNFLNPKAQFNYKWCLYSAGHAELDLTKDSPKEDMFRQRDKSTSWTLGDSGGFQIGKGVWVKRNMSGTPLKFGYQAQGKARFAGPNKILIDDRTDNISAWKAAGGIGILFKSTEQVKNELSKIGL